MFSFQEAAQHSSGQSLLYGLCHFCSQFIKMAERNSRLRHRCSLEVLAAALLSGCDVPQQPQHGSHPDLSTHIWGHLYLHSMAGSLCLVNPNRLVQLSSMRMRNSLLLLLSLPLSLCHADGENNSVIISLSWSCNALLTVKDPGRLS